MLAHRLLLRHPTLTCHYTAVWDYAYGDVGDIEIGQHVSIGAFAEIVVYRRSPRSRVEGRLVLGDRVLITAGVNIRAAGGTIRIGDASGIGQHSVVVAANHSMTPGREHLYSQWEEGRTGVELGRNVWVSAQCVLLPGTRIGDNSVIGSASVVRGEVPANEVWAGVPARRIRSLEPGDAGAGQSPSQQTPDPPG
jgi:acetyltransferase-like isoleucine patch superfamily enzyme